MTHPEFDRKFRDRISGFEGTCTGIARYIDGTTQVQLVPVVDNPGVLLDCKWFDVGRLEDPEGKGPVGFGGKS